MTGQPVAYLHWLRADRSLKLVFVCIWIWRPETFFFSSVPYWSSNNFLTKAQSFSWKKFSLNTGVDLSTVISSKSYWHFHLTVFLSNIHNEQSPSTLQTPAGGTQLFNCLTAQNLEWFANTTKLLSYSSSEIKTPGGAVFLHSSENTWISYTPTQVTISSELLCLPQCR